MTLAYLSTGETTFAAKAAEAGESTRAGMDVRLIELSADAGAGMGAWQNLHGFETPRALANHLRAAAATYCGTAALAFLVKLVKERAENAVNLEATLTALKNAFLKKHVTRDMDGQVSSVGTRFAILAAAGELSTDYGVLPWPRGEAIRAAGACFQKWITARGSVGAGEDVRGVEQVRASIATHGSLRFEPYQPPPACPPDDNRPDFVPSPEKIPNRLGFKQRVGGLGGESEWRYLFHADAWKNEVCKGLDHQQVARALLKLGFLEHDDGRLTVSRQLGQHGSVRAYAVKGSILGYMATTDGRTDDGTDD
jgi:uncharacterized protein (DUF927 family)